MPQIFSQPHKEPLEYNFYRKFSATALLGALCYIGFMFLKINIPTPGGTTAIHFGNTFCVLAALLIGGVEGGIAGAIGMGLADLMDPIYILCYNAY